MDAWSLPASAVIGGREYAIHADFRDVLDILERLGDASKPEFLRWAAALALFYEGYDAMPPGDRGEAAEYLARFLNCGRPEAAPGPKLLDWRQDAPAIAADVNKVAGCEIRALPFLHWWSFMAFFDGVGEGRLSMLVSVRDKLRRGKKLEPWEQEFYRAHKAQVEFAPRYTPAELAERRRLEALLAP